MHRREALLAGSMEVGVAEKQSPSVADLEAFVGSLAEPIAAATDDERVELIRTLEQLQGVAWAAQARLCVDFAQSQRAEQLAQGIAADRAGTAVADDLAIVRQESPHRASNHLASARALVAEMPQTLAALLAGTIKPRQAQLLTQVTACLSAEDRAEVDEQMADQLAGRSDRQLRAEATARVYALDPQAYVERGRRAAKDRYVAMHPAPDVMAMIRAYLPAADGVACYRALRVEAESMRGAGDPRSIAQLMADIFVARITGTDPAVGHSIELGLVLTDATLADGDTLPAILDGYGPIPAQSARDLLQPPAPEPSPPAPAAASMCAEGDRCTSGDCGLTHRPLPSAPPPRLTSGALGPKRAKVWLRRLYTDPLTGQLAFRDRRRRRFDDALRAFILSRDQYCRTPWCGAPIRHIDHIVRARDQGPTDQDNGRGLCARCNLSREKPRHVPVPPTLYLRGEPLIPGLGGATPVLLEVHPALTAPAA